MLTLSPEKYHPPTAGNSHHPLMQLLGLIKLDDFKCKHADARGPLDAWRLEAEQAQSAGPRRRPRYPGASFLADDKMIFNIKGKTYRLVIKGQLPKRLDPDRVGWHACRVQQTEVVGRKRHMKGTDVKQR